MLEVRYYSSMFEKPSNPRFEPLPESPEKAFKRYEKWLHLDGVELRGKTILDVGSASSSFGEYVEEHYPGATVLRFDRWNAPGFKVDFVAQAGKLPLREGSVDVALAHASITNNSGEEAIAALKEIFSIIKEGGEIHIAPIFDAPFEFSQKRLQLIRDYVAALESQGMATAEWKIDGVEERTTPKGQLVRETRYCLILRKQAVPD